MGLKIAQSRKVIAERNKGSNLKNKRVIIWTYGQLAPGYDNLSLQIIDCVKEGNNLALIQLEGVWQNRLAMFQVMET